MPTNHSPISPLLEDSVKEGVPSVQVGVEPSTDVGGVHGKPLEWLLEWPAPELPDSTLSDDFDFVSERDSNFISVILENYKNWELMSLSFCAGKNIFIINEYLNSLTG